MNFIKKTQLRRETDCAQFPLISINYCIDAPYVTKSLGHHQVVVRTSSRVRLLKNAFKNDTLA